MSRQFVDSPRPLRVPAAFIVLIDVIISFGVGALILLNFKIDTDRHRSPNL